MVDKENVLEVVVTSPDGETFRANSGSISGRMGSSPAAVSLVVEAGSRLREILEFDGSFTSDKKGNFVRSALPKPDAGQSLLSTGWVVTVDPPQPTEEGAASTGEAHEVGPLVLVEASVAEWSRAETAIGPPIFDTGQDRIESWQLSFVDPRIFWAETGYVAGRRNFRDRTSTSRVTLTEEKREFTIRSPKIKVEVEEDDEGVPRPTIVFDEPEEIEIELPAIADTFDPSSVRGPEGKAKLRSAFDLLEEIAERCPLLRAGPDGDLVGPPEMAAILKKLFPFDIDYKRGTPPAKAFDEISKRLGLVHGLELDSRLVFDFNGTPLASIFESSGVIGKQLRWIEENRGARVKPRTSGVRFYPSRVVKQVPLTDWELIAKDDKNEILLLSELTEQVGLSGQEGEVAYNPAIKSRQELTGDKTLAEREFLKRSEKTIDRDLIQKFRRLSDWAFRGYRFAPTPKTLEAIRKVVEAAQAEVIAKFDEETRAPESLGRGGKDALAVEPRIVLLNSSALLDQLVRAPLNVVTKIDGVGELKPAFFGDIIFHRLFDFLDTGSTIVVASFDPALPPGENFLTQTFNNFVEEFELLDLKRRPMASSEAGAQKLTLQTAFRTFLGERTGFMSDERIEQFWQRFQAFKINSTPIEMFVTWPSGDATELVDKFDPKAGIVRFKIPLGRFLGSKSFRFFLANSVRVMRARADQIDADNLGVIATVDAEIFRLWAATIEKLLERDRLDTATILKVRPEALEPEIETFLGVTGGVSPDNFKKIVQEFRRRSPFEQLWQIASLNVAIEAEEQLNETPGSPDDVDGAGESDQEILSEVPVEGSGPELDLEADESGLEVLPA